MTWTLIGREAEQAALERALTDPTTRGVVLTGEAGAGKTRLALDFLEHVGETHPTASVIATAGASETPFGAFAPILPPLPADLANPLQLLQFALRAIEHRAGSGEPPLVLSVDDAHLLDEQSAALLHQLATGARVFVLATIRTGEPVPDALTGLWKDELAARIEVGPLPQDEARSLAEAILGQPLDPRTTAAIWGLARGNPLFIRELAFGGVENGALSLVDGRWCLQSPLSPSSRLVEVVEARIGGTSRAQRRALDLLAVGEPLPLSLALRLPAGAGVERLEQRQIVAVERDGATALLRFSHPLYGEVLRAAMPRTRFARLSRSLADAADEAGALDELDVVRLATWRLDGGGGANTQLLIKAARRGLATFDHAFAERAARAALSNGGDFEAALTLGEALAGLGRLDEASQTFEALDHDVRGADRVTRLALARARLLFFFAWQVPEALAVLDVALTRVRGADGRDHLLAQRATFTAMIGDMRASAGIGRRLLRRGSAKGPAAATTLAISSISLVILGRFDRAQHEIDAGLVAAEGLESELPLMRDQLLVNRALALAYEGRLREAVALARTHWEQTLKQGAQDVVVLWGAVYSDVLIHSGRVSEAARVATEALALAAGSDPLGVEASLRGAGAVALATIGDLAPAEDLLAGIDVDQIAADARARSYTRRAQAWLTAVRGDVADGARAAREAGAQGLDDTHVMWGIFAIYDCVRLGHGEEVARPLSEAMRTVQGPLARAMVAHAEALAGGDGAALTHASDQFSRLGAALYAAEASAQASRIHLSAGEHTRAAATAARAMALAEPGGGLHTPVVRALGPHPLTEREREIAALAAAGLTSNQIAEHLVVSRRTVDNHLGSMYTTLGVHNRGELERFVPRPPAPLP